MVQRIAMAPQGPEFSRFVMGYWRLMDWNMSVNERVSFIEQHLDLGVTTVDHADIYGNYQCEAAFGEALKQAPHLRSRIEIVSKCGIATKNCRRCQCPCFGSHANSGLYFHSSTSGKYWSN